MYIAKYNSVEVIGWNLYEDFIALVVVIELLIISVPLS